MIKDKDICKLLKRYRLTTVCLVVLWVLCLMPVPETPLSHVELIDKHTHVVMYFGLCSVMWAEYRWRRSKPLWCLRRRLVIGFAAPVLMSGLLELLQEYCTGGCRSGEWLDLLANAIGVAAAWIAGHTIIPFVISRCED